MDRRGRPHLKLNTMSKYRAIIIGTGQAGVPLAEKLNEAGWKTAIIEKGAPGGTCVNVGCTPTKVYLASAGRVHDARGAEELGVLTSEVAISLPKVHARKQSFVENSRQNIREALEKAEHVDLIEGHARFVDNKTVSVNGQELTAEKIFVNVGARAVIPDNFAEGCFLTNVEILELTELPEHLIIIGGSYIGLEFGQMFRRFGSEVTIVEQNDRIISHEDESVSEALREILAEEGIQFRFGAECISGHRRNDGRVEVSLDCDDDKTITGSHLLLAVGRRPNTDDLGLENTDLETDDQGHIRVQPTTESTTVPGVYVLGDCNGEGQFTHTSYHDYQVVSNQLFGDSERTIEQRIRAYGLYTEPALGRVGQTEAEARQDGYTVTVFDIPMSKVARARQMNKDAGLLRVVVDADSDKILGAALLGHRADELINGIADLMYAGAPYTTIRDAMHIHPTVAEMLPSMLEG